MKKLLQSSFVLLTLGVLFSGFTVAASAQPFSQPAAAGFQPGQKLTGFKPIDDYQLLLDGEEEKSAEIFSNPTPAILVKANGLEAPVVLWPRSRAVESINTMKLAKGDAGGLDIYPDPVIERHAGFEVKELEVHFTVGDTAAVLRPRPPLVGLYGAAGLRERSVKYADRADYYEPTTDLVEKLKGESRDVRVRVFFGTWCPACGQMVPRIMRVAEQLEGSKLEFEFYGLPKGFSGEPEAEAYNVHSVPTGVVFVDGREVGRIAGTEWRSPEAAIDNLINGS